MELVNFFAEFWGFSTILISLSLLIKPKHIKNALMAVENEITMLWVGIFTVMLGIFCVLTYNVWDSSWKTVITVINWLVLIKGATFLFIPETVTKMINKWKTAYMDALPVVLVVMVIFGCVLVYFGLTY